jgi:hypothetical protein
MRPDAEMEVRSLPPGGAKFLGALARGRTLTQAARSALRVDPHFDLSANLAALIGAGALIGYCLTGDTAGGSTATAT